MDQYVRYIDLILGGAIGFISAYGMARISRRAEERAAARDRRLAVIHKIRVPLSIILSEIDNRMGFYFNQHTVSGILDRLREDAVALLDEDVIFKLEEGVVDLRALGVHHNDDVRAKARPRVMALLERLHELVMAEEPEMSRWQRWRRRRSLKDPFRI